MRHASGVVSGTGILPGCTLHGIVCPGREESEETALILNPVFTLPVEHPVRGREFSVNDDSVRHQARRI